MSEQRIRIVSDGTAIGTKVYTASGEDLSGCITGITINRIETASLVTATIDFIVDLDVTAKPEFVKRVPPPAPMPDIGGLVGGRNPPWLLMWAAGVVLLMGVLYALPWPL